MKAKTASNNNNNGAHNFLNHLQAAPNPRFTSADKRVSWEHTVLSLEALLLIGELPTSFTTALSNAYSVQLNRAFNGQAPEATERKSFDAPEFIKGMQQLVISTSVNPRFHDGADDPDNNLVSVTHVRPYLQEFFAHALESAAAGPVELVNGSEVSVDTLKTFPDRA